MSLQASVMNSLRECYDMIAKFIINAVRLITAIAS